MLRGKPLLWFAAPLMLLACAARAQPAPEKLDTLKDLFIKLHSCFKPPPLSQANPIDITVIVSFNRQGAILGRPRITYETAEASENDRLQYRIAVMQALERCTPLPFTDALGGAVAGRPMAIPFRTRKRQPEAKERRAWLSPKTL
ncbi:hypothetical protein AAFX91_37565 [Bradyrhizobium sp. 31Argb]|uniref:hypothetical protein n=1 Tax=Bradyrhizobium sp. 31Argb TaxID=3141247 RepID=UPI0037482092